MLLYYLSVIVIFAFLLAGVISMIYTMQWKKEMSQVVLQKMDLIENYANKQIGEVRNIHETMLENSKIQNFMNAVKAGEETSADREDVFQWMQQYKEKNANIISCLLINNQGRILDTRSENSIYVGLIEGNEYYSEAVSSKRMSYFSVPATFPLQKTNPTYEDKNTVTYYGRYYDNENYETTGYLILNWKKSGLFDHINEVCGSTFEHAFILNDMGKIVYQYDEIPEQVYKSIADKKNRGDGTKDVVLLGDRYLLCYRTIDDYPDWKFYGLISYEKMETPLRKVYVTLVFITLGMLLLVAWISFGIADGITKPIYHILKAMKQMGRGEFPEPVKVTSEDEMRELASGFNAMVYNIHDLQEKIIQDQNKQKETEVSMIKSKLDLLQSQINPHFIHNTLNTMKYMAQIEGNDKLVQTIIAFNTLLRSSMNTGKEFITVSEEIDNINHYLDIQKQRYDAEVRVECFVFDDVDLALIPKLILQPLVENSLFHGIVPKGKGTIKIIFRKEGSKLSISVSDDGVGIASKKQEHILEEKENSQRGYNNIGLTNVNERLNLYYGKESKLLILSSAEYGTFISFRIPFEE